MITINHSNSICHHTQKSATVEYATGNHDGAHTEKEVHENGNRTVRVEMCGVYELVLKEKKC